MFGLKGSGIESLVRSTFGIDERDSGQVFLEKKELPVTKPSDSTRNGIAFVPADRKEEGIIPDMDVRENVIISAVEKGCKFGVVLRKKTVPQVVNIIERMRIDCTGMMQKISNLSGGNQQKVVLGRFALFKGAKVLLMADPTRGVDVGARAEIHSLLNGLASKGLSILVGSPEVDEILTISDRILVMQDGRITREFVTKQTNKEEILSVALSRRISAQEKSRSKVSKSKKKRNMVWVLGVAAILVLVIGFFLLRSGNSSSNPSTAAASQIGEALDVGGIEFTVERSYESKGTDSNRPKLEHVYTIARISLKNRSTQPVTVKAGDFTLTVNGNEIPLKSLSYVLDSLVEIDLQPGATMEGALAWETPLRYKTKNLEYSGPAGKSTTVDLSIKAE